MLSIVIVDDEMSTLNGISNILKRHPEEFHVAAACTSAVQALDFLSEVPEPVDVVITDIRMPVMDGVEFVGILAEQYPQIRVIVLSGYSDFEYVRACLTKGAADYLLKPCRYQALLDILRKIGDEKAARQTLQEKESTTVRIRSMILSGTGSLPEEFPHATAYLLYGRVAEGQDGLPGHIAQYVRAHFPHLENLFFAVELEGDALCILGGDASEEATEALRQELYSHFSESGLLSAMAYSPPEHRDALAAGAKSCRNLCYFAEFNDIDRPVSLAEEELLLSSLASVAFEDYLNPDNVQTLLYLRTPEAVSQGFARFTAPMLDIPGFHHPSRLRKGGYQLLFELEKMLPEQASAPAKLPGLFHDFTGRIRDARNLPALLRVIEEYILAVWEKAPSEPRYPRYISTAIAYIKSHYMEDILLSDLSREVFLNEWYFSSQFKKHMGVGFKDYLNETRIEAAKELLAHGDLKIGQVAEMVGFGDAAYFATAFKGVTGKTPKEYRRTRAVK